MSTILKFMQHFLIGHSSSPTVELKAMHVKLGHFLLTDPINSIQPLKTEL
jgi:hypothetical protein